LFDIEGDSPQALKYVLTINLVLGRLFDAFKVFQVRKVTFSGCKVHILFTRDYTFINARRALFLSQTVMENHI